VELPIIQNFAAVEATGMGNSPELKIRDARARPTSAQSARHKTDALNCWNLTTHVSGKFAKNIKKIASPL
jgi:hypothetical protein